MPCAAEARRGRLHRIHRGVLRIRTLATQPRGTVDGSSPRVREGAVLSHRSAAALWGLHASGRDDHRCDDSVGRRALAQDRSTAHRTRTLTLADVTRCAQSRAPPCLERFSTLAEVVGRRRLEHALEQAEVLRIFDLTAMNELLARASGRRGSSILQAVLGLQRKARFSPRASSRSGSLLCTGIARPASAA